MNRILQRRRRLKMMGTGVPIIAPSSMGNLVAWYSARTLSSLWQDSARTTPVTAQGQTVGAWDDISGNNRHLTQATGADEPTYRTGDLLGRPTLLLDGTDFLSTTDAWVATAFGGVDKPVSYLLVVVPTDLTGTQTYAALGRNAANGYRWFRQASGTEQYNSSHDGGGAVANNANAVHILTVNQPYVVGARYDGTNAELFKNFDLIYGPTAAVATGTTVSINRFAVGSLVRNTNDNFYIGHIAEVVLCTTMTEAERIGVTSYLRQAYGL